MSKHKPISATIRLLRRARALHAQAQTRDSVPTSNPHFEVFVRVFKA